VPEPGRRLRRPTLDDFAFEGEQVPLLLRKRALLAIAVVFAAVVAAYVVAANAFGVSFNVNAGPFRDWVDGFGVWGPFIFIAVMALSVLFAPIPNVPIFIAAGLAWGPVVGTAYSMAGLLLGSAMAFFVARWFGRRHLPRLIGAKAAARLDNVSETMGGQMIFWLRMLPAVNFDWISFAAGMTSIRFSVFIVFSALGMLLPTALVVVAGDGLDGNPEVTLAMGGVWVAGIVASAAFFWYRRRRWKASRSERAAAAAARLEA
jgi:uncharacterized membrane protein YdjX (TVP38/TMEM64 family)